MKKVAFLILILSVQTVDGQKSDSCYAGVYLTYHDFKNNLLSHKVNTMLKGNSVGFASFGKTVKVISSGKTVKYKPGSIYGFYDCQAIYRYSPNVELYSPEDYYKIEEVDSLIIYTSIFYGGAEHFYSLGLSAPVHRLSMSHIEEDFKHYPQFIEAIKKMKSANMGELAARDTSGFKINKIFRETVIKKNEALILKLK